MGRVNAAKGSGKEKLTEGESWYQHATRMDEEKKRKEREKEEKEKKEREKEEKEKKERENMAQMIKLTIHSTQNDLRLQEEQLSVKQTGTPELITQYAGKWIYYYRELLGELDLKESHLSSFKIKELAELTTQASNIRNEASFIIQNTLSITDVEGLEQCLKETKSKDMSLRFVGKDYLIRAKETDIGDSGELQFWALAFLKCILEHNPLSRAFFQRTKVKERIFPLLYAIVGGPDSERLKSLLVRIIQLLDESVLARRTGKNPGGNDQSDLKKTSHKIILKCLTFYNFVTVSVLLGLLIGKAYATKFNPGVGNTLDWVIGIIIPTSFACFKALKYFEKCRWMFVGIFGLRDRTGHSLPGDV